MLEELELINENENEIEINELVETKEIKIKSFIEHEKIFTERTGKDFSFFYKKYYPRLIYYTNKFCKDTQKAEDLTTESFMIAFEKIEKYEKNKSQFSTWLFTIARNIVLQDKKNQKKTISIDIDLDDEGTTLKDFISEEDDNSYLKNLSDTKAKIMVEHIDKLKEPYKTVIEMREIRKMSYKDISDQLGRNLSTVKSQIRNGRAILMENTKREFKVLDNMYL